MLLTVQVLLEHRIVRSGAAPLLAAATAWLVLGAAAPAPARGPEHEPGAPAPRTEPTRTEAPRTEVIAAAEIDAALAGIETAAPLVDGLRAAYAAAGGLPRLVGEGGPGAAGARLEAALARLPDHAIPQEPYAVAVIAAARDRLPAPDAARQLDVLLVRAFLLLAEDLRAPERGDAAALVARLEVARGSADAMARALHDWLPPWPQYGALVAAHRRYRAAAAAVGDDGPLPGARDLPRPGERHPAVPALRRRLAREGFHPPLASAVGEPPAVSDQYDGPLREAIGHFQYTHALEATGTLDAATLAAIAVPLEWRARTIGLALRRLRESAARGQGTFLRVNVPQFVAELFVADRPVRRFRVIVGNDDLVRDPESGRRGRLNRTPLLSGQIDRVVLNPVWRVPARIRDAELVPLSRDDPGLWERDGYLVRGDSVVQLPGPRNALGRVKFLFENGEGVYLHDTPAKHLFRRPRRAFSHGCVRMEHPLPLARWLLDREDHPRRGEWDDLLSAGREVELTLEQPLPIVIEYVTVAVDGEGRVHFFEDVYGHDAAALR